MLNPFRTNSPVKLRHTEIFYSFLVLCNPFIRLANKVNWRAGRPYGCADPLYPGILDARSYGHL
jgi:hypothetical protein